ncbi:hypothetical protein I7I51_05073 [Histoplasma capsulatum]|uniref:Peroxin 19 n=1 Tax=Ajellomyces capsulatus TaxID=5037 RepID=A0A8A1M1D7_AJECA|nr:predicted protein [Histoplasma mississippiense (nom. inval.)]EDN04050.1 predicted protein [Histoplasma mississippiense (nom. inval.)]QSS60276.1 hypothetical protein I7I51_05073 [Histoplasma capsulatum]
MAEEGKKEKDKIEEEGSMAVPAEASSTAAVQVTVTEADSQAHARSTVGLKRDEEDSDFDLDDLLDDFSPSKNLPSATPAASSSNKPPSASASTSAAGPQLPPSFPSDQNVTGASESDLDEDAFLRQLEHGMAGLLHQKPTGSEGGGGDGGDGGSDSEPDWDALAQRMAQGEMDPTAVMKLLMGEGGPGALAGGIEGDLGGLGTSGGSGKEDEKGESGTTSGATDAAGAARSASNAEDGFQQTIRKTMERIQASGDKATAAAGGYGADDDDDVLMRLLKAVGSSAAGHAGAGEADDESLDKLFMGIMEQLSNKDMLYEPMKELNDKFSPWLRENRDKVPKEDLERYELQATIVAEIVAKFDEEGYSDDNPADRAAIWEKMQKMQAAGSPPDALVSNPLADELGLPGAFAGVGGGGGGGAEMPQCPQQ